MNIATSRIYIMRSTYARVVFSDFAFRRDACMERFKVMK